LALSSASLAGYVPGSPAADRADRADAYAETEDAPDIGEPRAVAQALGAAPLRYDPAPRPSAGAQTAASRNTLQVVPAAYRAPARTVAAPAAFGTGTGRGAKAVRLASLQAGKPYRYGAAGPRSFDCSGFVQYVYKKLGKTLPRTTGQQYAATARLPRGSQRPGDLIFFGRPGAIYHAGIYAGGGKIWVAPKTGDVVKLQRIWSPSYLVGRVR
jgi:cell wall-associated NlpC family hydrolase